MPGDSGKTELLNLTRGLQSAVETAQLFGEESFSGSFPSITVASAGPTVPAGDISAPAIAPRSRLRDGPAPKTVPVSIPVSITVPASPVAASASAADKRKRLEALYQKYAGCVMCPLSEGRTKVVFGVGSVDHKVLFIGEGPGFDEDKQGYPFVGRAGQLLDKIMQSIGLSRASNAYIANVVKCHPMKDPAQPQMRGNDRPPTPSEVSACKEILDQQLEILDPPIICVLGASAARAMLNTTEGITALRGKIFDFKIPGSGKTVPLLPTYHPAALLRNELLKKDVWQDMKLLRTYL